MTFDEWMKGDGGYWFSAMDTREGAARAAWEAATAAERERAAKVCEGQEGFMESEREWFAAAIRATPPA